MSPDNSPPDRGARTQRLITLAFSLLALGLSAVLAAYWHWLMEPRLQAEGTANANLIAQAQIAPLNELLNLERGWDSGEMQAAIDRVLLSTDPATATPYVRHLRLELQADVVGTMPAVSAGEACPQCFQVEVPLISPWSLEIIGIAVMSVSDDFFQRLRADILNKLFLEWAALLALLLIAALAVRYLTGQLSHELAERRLLEAKLVRARDAAEAMSEAKGQFLANMSHEIRTPMNAIIGMGYLLAKTPLNERQDGLLGNIRHSASVLLQLINDILDFSKVDAGKLSLETIGFRLEDVLDQLAVMVGTKASENQVEVIIRVQPEVPDALVGDPLRLGQVLLNLVNNAIKFSHEGEVVVSVSAMPADRGARLQFSVRDTGIGIEPEIQARLFDPFTQADGSVTRKFGGTGLGLAISRSLVEAMHGQIGVESTPGEGSHFWFAIPFECQPDAPGAEALLPDEYRGRQILVVDDNDNAREMLSLALSQFGFEVRSFSSATVALEQLGADELAGLSLVLMDWRMPGVDGLTAGRQLKQQQPELPVILVTAYGQADIISEAESALDGCLLKPVSQSTLYDAVVTAFGGQVIRRRALSDTEAPPQYKAHVLVAEDNELNQIVVRELLEEAGCTARICGNGLRALDALQEESFDLVLMDVQMPELDGLSTTRKIREDAQYEDLPVIAMTAHAMEGDRERCLDAGMNDYINKPVDLQQFHAMLGRWAEVAVSDGMVATEPVSAASALSPDQVIDLGALKKSTGGSLTTALRCVKAFIEAHRGSVAALRDEAEALSSDRVRAILHDLRGEAGLLGAGVLLARLDACEGSEQTPADTPDQTRRWGLAEALQQLLQAAELELESMRIELALSQIQGLDFPAGLRRVGGKLNLYQQLLHRFCAEQSQSIAALAKKLASDQIETATAMAHGIKGVAGNLGVNAVFELAKTLEHALREGRPAGELPAEIEAQITALATRLPALSEPAPAVAPPMDAAAWNSAVVELQKLLANNDLRAEAALKKLQTAAGLGKAQKAALGEVAVALQAYDFVGATAALENLDILVAS